MRTKVIQARHLQIHDEVVDGGDGVRRTAHRICELHINPERVEVVVRLPEGFDRRPFKPRDPVRVKEAS